MLAALLMLEVVFRPEAIPGTPRFHTLRDILSQLLVSPNTITGDFFLSTRKTFAAIWYPATWLAGLAFAVPYDDVSNFCSRSVTYAHSRLSDITVSISNLFP